MFRGGGVLERRRIDKIVADLATASGDKRRRAVKGLQRLDIIKY